MAKIVSSYTKLVMPFVYQEGQKINDKVWEFFDLKPQHLNNETVSKMSMTSKNTVGRSYRMTQVGRSQYNLPKDHRSFLDLKGRQFSTTLALNNVYLHLFENEIGFIEFDVTFFCELDSQLLQAAYFLFEIEDSSNTLTYHKKTGKDEIVDYEFNIATKAKEILGALFVHSFDPHFSDSLQYLKPHAFSVVIVDKKEENLLKTLFRLKNIYKESYQVCDEEAIKNVYQPFDNISWGFSPVGVACVTHLTNNKTTDDFIESGFVSATRMQYYYLALLALNQKYNILKQNAVIGKINERFEEMAYDDLLIAKEALDQITAKTVAYSLRNDIDIPSTEMHINHFYDNIVGCLQIKRMGARLSQRLDDLAMLSKAYQAKIEGEKVKQSEFNGLKEQCKKLKIEILIFVISQIIGSFSLFKLVWEIIEKVVGEKVPVNSWLISIPIAIVVIFMMVLCLQIYLRIVELKKIKILKKNHSLSK